MGNAAAPRRVDFFKVAGIPDRVENPYLFPPWAYATTPNGKKTALVAPPKAPARANDAEFVSGMSEARQKEVEAGIGTLFGAGKKGK